MKAERGVGPAPARQAAWDWRAAGNFIAGGAGGGLVVASALSGVEGVGLSALMAAGGALVGAGLTCVWLEIGRPLRALHVFFNPRTSWMSREAFAAALLLPAVALIVAGVIALAPLAALCALAFIYCQARMLKAARGIVAWREARLVPLIVASALAEGAGLLVMSSLAPDAWRVALGVLVLARVVAWVRYRRAVEAKVVPQALAALDAAGRVLVVVGTLLPLALLPAAALVDATWLAAAAGAAATLAGSYFKFVLVTRAGFNTGFALAHLPVRGVPHRRET